jgi:hypothetical protein
MLPRCPESTCASSLWYAYHNEDYGESRVMLRPASRVARAHRRAAYFAAPSFP